MKSWWHVALGFIVAVACAAVANPGELLPDADAAHKMAAVYLVLLRKGPAWSGEETPATKAIQDAHMANIRRMWEAKKLIIAGPLGDNGDIRGIFLFDVGSLEEAKQLAEADPAIKAGRLVAEIHPWWVERQALPEAGAYCQTLAPPVGGP
jgi:uncharacterized protein YciI